MFLPRIIVHCFNGMSFAAIFDGWMPKVLYILNYKAFWFAEISEPIFS